MIEMSIPLPTGSAILSGVRALASALGRAWSGSKVGQWVKTKLGNLYSAINRKLDQFNYRLWQRNVNSSPIYIDPLPQSTPAAGPPGAGDNLLAMTQEMQIL